MELKYRISHKQEAATPDGKPMVQVNLAPADPPRAVGGFSFLVTPAEERDYPIGAAVTVELTVGG